MSAPWEVGVDLTMDADRHVEWQDRDWTTCCGCRRRVELVDRGFGRVTCPVCGQKNPEREPEGCTGTDVVVVRDLTPLGRWTWTMDCACGSLGPPRLSEAAAEADAVHHRGAAT